MNCEPSELRPPCGRCSMCISVGLEGFDVGVPSSEWKKAVKPIKLDVKTELKPDASAS